MRIRIQLVLLVLAVIAPVALLAAIATVGLWEFQRDAYRERYLERVQALRIALDAELDATLRQLHTLSDMVGAEADEASAFRHHAEQLMTHYPSWSLVGLLDAAGGLRATVQRNAAFAGSMPDTNFVMDVIAERQATISNLTDAPATAATHMTYLAIPITTQGSLRGVVYVGIESSAWLEFFQRYPLHDRATLTLNDREGRVITSTMNNAKWVGTSAITPYWKTTLGRDEGTLINVGDEGQRFYSAFSRSRTASWVVGSGVPQDVVEASLGRPTLVIVIGVLAAGGFATVFAYLLGGRITGALTSLASSVRSMTAGERRVPQEPLHIEEAETVRRALIAGARLLAAREASLNEALSREGQARADAEHASRAKDDLLAMLGHELRNPINAINAAIAVLDMAAADSDVSRRARQVVQRQVGQLTSIVNDLLDVARLDSGKARLHSRPLDLAEVVRHVLETFEQTGRSGGLRIAARLSSAQVMGDETRLEQVVSNLFDNACKYTPVGGQVVISLRAELGCAVLEIRDSGSGIAADVLPRIFELFAQGSRTLDRAQGGLGLGLTVVRQLVELHGGTISATSEGLDRGATFTVRLPLTQGEIRPQTPAAIQAMPSLRIAVVEDNADNRHLVAEMLRFRGHRVVEAADGMRGVQLIAAGDIDVGLIDIGLPGLNGYEVARRLRASTGRSELCLIALTGYGGDEDRTNAMAAGFDAFLVKPLEIEAFEAAVRAWSARRSSKGLDTRAERTG